jgi:hypothetical protein
MVAQARAAGGKAGAQAQGGLQKVAQGAGAARAQAGKVAEGGRAAAGKAAGKVGAKAKGAAQRVRDGSKKVVRRKRAAVTDGAVDGPGIPGGDEQDAHG